MGQTLCQSRDDSPSTDDTFGQYSASLLRESKMTFFSPISSQSGSSYSSRNVCKELGLGEYLVDQLKVSRMWNEVLHILKIINTEQQTMEHSHDFFLRKRTLSGQVVISNSEMLVPEREEDTLNLSNARVKYPFISSKEDNHMVQFHILDQKGLLLLLSLGPPREYRWSAWKTVILVPSKLDKRYETYLSQGIQDDQINMDIQRTLISHKFFQKACTQSGGFGQFQLLRVLQGIITTYPNLGYCQGMNFIAGFMLMVSGCDENLTYQMLLNLLVTPKYLMYFVYCDRLPLVHLLTSFTYQLMDLQDPQLIAHLQAIEVPDSFWVTKMIMSLFLYVCSIDTSLRLWDYYIARGLFAIVELAVAIVHSMRGLLLVSDLELIGTIFTGQQRQNGQYISIDVQHVIHLARTKCRLKRRMVVQFTKQFLQIQHQKQGRKSLEFEILFLDYEQPDVFNSKVAEYLRRINVQ